MVATAPEPEYAQQFSTPANCSSLARWLKESEV
jgi:hypothetical protein